MNIVKVKGHDTSDSSDATGNRMADSHARAGAQVYAVPPEDRTALHKMDKATALIQAMLANCVIARFNIDRLPHGVGEPEDATPAEDEGLPPQAFALGADVFVHEVLQKLDALGD